VAGGHRVVARLGQILVCRKRGFILRCCVRVVRRIHGGHGTSSVERSRPQDGGQRTAKRYPFKGDDTKNFNRVLTSNLVTNA
jgi:hypothetical protein